MIIFIKYYGKAFLFIVRGNKISSKAGDLSFKTKISKNKKNAAHMTSRPIETQGAIFSPSLYFLWKTIDTNELIKKE